MSTALVSLIIRGDEEMAKVFYPGSAYSIKALERAKRFLEALDYREDMDDREVRLQLIRACEKCGGGLDGIDARYVLEMYPHETFREDGSREDGLISISRYAMDVVEKFADGLLLIDLDYMTVSSAVWRKPVGEPGGIMVKSGDIGEACQFPFNLASIKKEDLAKVICLLKQMGKPAYQYGDCTWGIINNK